MNEPPLARREFGRRVAGGLACALPLALAGGTATFARVEAAPPEDAASSRRALGDQPAPQAQPPAMLGPEEHYLALVQLLYPHERLGEAELQEVRRQIQAMLVRSRVLSSFPLTNADEPATQFAAYRGGD